MPKLVPEDLIRATNIIKAVATPEAQNKIKTDVQSDLQLQLINANLTTEDTLGVISQIMHTSRKDTTRLAAAKVGLQLNGLLDKDNDSNVQQPNLIQFVFQDSNVNLNGMFNPKR